MTDASAVAGAYRQRGLAWVRQAGGVRPRRGRDLQGRYLSFGEREENAWGRAVGESIRSIPRRPGRSSSTISRGLARNSDGKGAIGPRPRIRWPMSGRTGPRRPGWSRTWSFGRGSSWTWRRSTRPNRSLEDFEMTTPTTRRCECPPRPSTSPCTCSRVVRCAVTWRNVCAPGAGCASPTARAPSARAVSCRHDQDRRASGGGRPCGAWALGGGSNHRIQTSPASLRGSLVWDQGVEMRDWKQVQMTTDLTIFFCDPHAPWQCETNETPTGCCGSISPRAPTCRCTAKPT